MADELIARLKKANLYRRPQFDESSAAVRRGQCTTRIFLIILIIGAACLLAFMGTYEQFFEWSINRPTLAEYQNKKRCNLAAFFLLQ